MSAAKKAQHHPERCNESYIAIPHRVLDSVAFQGASPTAKALLVELVRQHTVGRDRGNNGHLQLTFAWLSKRGWKSKDTIQRAKLELIERGLIVETWCGGKNAGPSKYAVTWLSITNFSSLAIRSNEYRRGAWILMDQPPLPGNGKSAAPVDGAGSPAIRGSAGPVDGAAKVTAGPVDGAKTSISGAIAAPSTGLYAVTATPLLRS